MFLLTCLILAGFWLVSQVERGAIQPLFLATPTPTRTILSYTIEGDALFTAGELDAAITAYQQAVAVDPTDAGVWAKLARIQTYSSNMLTTNAQRKERLLEAQVSIDQAVALAPEDSTVHAIRSFVLDWSASAAATDGERQSLLIQAEQEALQALQLDNQNVLAQAFYAEALIDQQKWSQAEQVILQALQRDPSIMDVHRVYAYVLESTSRYSQAIEEYLKALAINPNLTFLYISVGANYRRLAFDNTIPNERDSLYDSALEYFAKAANIDKQLGIKDPVPYIAIAKTYSQKGEFFIAARNIRKALSFDPVNPEIFGQLGIIYFKARNYEGSILVLKCAVRGCTAEEGCEARGGCSEGEQSAPIVGLPLSQSTVVYYYTYGSVLAALSRPQQNYCSDAVAVLTEVQAAYGSDPTIAQIVSDGLSICSFLGESLPETPAPTATPITRP